jgi:glyoxylase-like metal-dependent hydrolase (beta-lactamase superfamily II)
MKIDTLILGSYETNSYVLRHTAASSECLIIDTGLEPEPLLRFLQLHTLLPVAVIFTHGHADHIAGTEPLRAKFASIKVAIHKLDADMLSSSQMNLSVLAGVDISTRCADIIIDGDGPIELAGIRLETLHTPGHSPGGISLYSRTEKLVFSGDALFAGSVGRTDFPGGNGQQLIASIKDKLLTLPDETVVYPGHGPKTTIRREKAINPFLR